MKWRKELWGVMFRGSLPTDRPMLLGSAWHEVARLSRYFGEPPRALVFQTREDARAWCRDQHRKNAGRNDCCAEWRFTPVRVVEIVRADRFGVKEWDLYR